MNTFLHTALWSIIVVYYCDNNKSLVALFSDLYEFHCVTDNITTTTSNTMRTHIWIWT